MSDLVVNVQNLYVTFNKQTVLKDISFKLSTGEMLVILGPNGAGKSVLLRTLLGVHPHKGKMEWDKSVHIGFFPCNFVLPADLPLTINDFFSLKNAKEQEIIKAFKTIGMCISADFLQKSLSKLSTGQIRRVLIAWVLVDKPDVLLLDEPFSHIDTGGRNEIFESLLKLCKKNGVSIILVSHDISQNFKKADKVLAINKKLLFYDNPDIILSSKNLLKVYASDNL